MAKGRVRVAAVLVLLIALTGVPAVQAASLWNDQTAAANMFSDRKAHFVGDVLTILINENSSAVRSGKAGNTKAASTSMNSGVGIFHGLAAASAGNSDSFQAQGSIANTNVVSAKLTVQVTEIKPNGNLAFSGTQSIKQNGEEQKIIISGIVRPEDVSADNTVLSSMVADAQISIEGKGPVAGKQREGIITQLFNMLF